MLTSLTVRCSLALGMTASRKYQLRQHQDRDADFLADSLGATMLETPKQPSPPPPPPSHLDHETNYPLGRFIQNSPPPSSPPLDNDYQSQQQQHYISRARMSNDSVHTMPTMQAPRQGHHRRSSTTDGMTPRPSIASTSNSSVLPSPQSVRALRGPSNKAMPPLPRHSLPSSMAPPAGSPRTRALMRTIYPALLSRVAEAFQARITLSERAKDGLAYKDAFDGREAVALLAQIIKTTDRNLALLLGRALDAQKFFHDVTYDHRLRDSANEVYQFRTALPTPFMSGDELATATNGSAQPGRESTGTPVSTATRNDAAGPVRPNISPIAGHPVSAKPLSSSTTQTTSLDMHADTTGDAPLLLPVAASVASVAESSTSGGTPLSPVSTNEDSGSLPPYPGEGVGTASVDSHGQHPQQPQRLGSDQRAASPTILFGSGATTLPTAPAPRPSPSEALDAATAAATAAASDEIPLPSGVFTLLTECYSPTCTRDRLCYSIACPRRLEQQARLNLQPQPVLKRTISQESLGDLVVSFARPSDLLM